MSHDQEALFCLISVLFETACISRTDWKSDRGIDGGREREKETERWNWTDWVLHCCGFACAFSFSTLSVPELLVPKTKTVLSPFLCSTKLFTGTFLVPAHN